MGRAKARGGRGEEVEGKEHGCKVSGVQILTSGPRCLLPSRRPQC